MLYVLNLYIYAGIYLLVWLKIKTWLTALSSLLQVSKNTLCDLKTEEAKTLSKRLREIETRQEWLEAYVYENVQKINYVARERAKKNIKEEKATQEMPLHAKKRFGGAK